MPRLITNHLLTSWDIQVGNWVICVLFQTHVVNHRIRPLESATKPWTQRARSESIKVGPDSTDPRVFGSNGPVPCHGTGILQPT